MQFWREIVEYEMKREKNWYDYDDGYSLGTSGAGGGYLKIQNSFFGGNFTNIAAFDHLGGLAIGTSTVNALKNDLGATLYQIEEF